MTLSAAAIHAELERAGLGFIDYEELLDGLARSNDLELVPAMYDATFATGVQLSTVRLQPDTAEGPFFLARAHHVINGVVATVPALIDVQLSSRRITEGSVPYRHLFGFYEADQVAVAGAPYGYPYQPNQMPCVVVERGDVMQETIDVGAGQTIAANSFVQWYGFHLRKAGSHERTQANGAADRIAKDWRTQIGELYAIGLFGNGTNAGAGGVYASFQSQYACRWQWALAFYAAGGTTTDLRLRLGNIDLFPRGLQLPSFGAQLYRLGNLDLQAPTLLAQRILQSVNGNVYTTFVGARRLGG